MRTEANVNSMQERDGMLKESLGMPEHLTTEEDVAETEYSSLASATIIY